MNSTPYNGTEGFVLGNGNKLHILSIGSSTLITNNKFALDLSNFLYIPSATTNFLLVQYLCIDNDVFLEFHSIFFFIKDQTTKKTLLQGKRDDGLYRLHGLMMPFSINFSPSNGYPSIHFSISSIPFSVFYNLFGHPTYEIVKSIGTNYQLCNSNKECGFCTHCQVGKSYNTSFYSFSYSEYSTICLLYLDIWTSPIVSCYGY